MTLALLCLTGWFLWKLYRQPGGRLGPEAGITTILGILSAIGSGAAAAGTAAAGLGSAALGGIGSAASGLGGALGLGGGAGAGTAAAATPVAGSMGGLAGGLGANMTAAPAAASAGGSLAATPVAGSMGGLAGGLGANMTAAGGAAAPAGAGTGGLLGALQSYANSFGMNMDKTNTNPMVAQGQKDLVSGILSELLGPPNKMQVQQPAPLDLGFNQPAQPYNPNDDQLAFLRAFTMQG